MANLELFSCPICLHADVQPQMVQIHIGHGAVVRNQDIALCWRCAGVIAGAYEVMRKQQGEADRDLEVGGYGGSEVHSPPNDQVPVSPEPVAAAIDPPGGVAGALREQDEDQ